jgi:hypothetical protein
LPFAWNRRFQVEIRDFKCLSFGFWPLVYLFFATRSSEEINFEFLTFGFKLKSLILTSNFKLQTLKLNRRFNLKLHRKKQSFFRRNQKF